MRLQVGFSSLVSLAFFLIFGARLNARGLVEVWKQQIGTNGHPAVVAADKGGNIFVTGGTLVDDTDLHHRKFDLFTGKYSGQDGHLIWFQSYDDPENLSDLPAALALDSSGNLIVTGYVESMRFGYLAKDIRTVKYAAADGAVLWEHFYDGPDHLDDLGSFVLVDGADDILLVGASSSLEGQQDIYTAKYSGEDGSVLWEAYSGSPTKAADTPYAAALDARGNVFVSEASKNGAYVLKYANTDGRLLWQQGIPAYRSLLVDTNGDMFVSGTSVSNRVSKYSGKDGTLIWEKNKMPPHPGKEESSGQIAFDHDGNIVVVGGFWVPSTLFNESGLTLAKFSPNGTLLWENLYRPAPQSSIANGNPQIDANGDIIMWGFFNTSPVTYTNFLAKFSGLDGSLVWRLDQPEFDYGTITLAPGGKVVLAARTATPKEQFPGRTPLANVLYQDDLSPYLAVSTTAGGITVTWPKTFIGWNLEERSGLDAGREWTKVAVPVGANTYQVPIGSATGPLLFRLTKPD